MFTTQETYERIRSYFSRPGAVLARKNGQCFYRSPQGNKCAVGCLIPDELYDLVLTTSEGEEYTLGSSIEETSVEHIIDAHPRLKTICDGESEEGRRKLDFLSEAQFAHDTSDTQDVPEFLGKLDVLARKYGLMIPTQ